MRRRGFFGLVLAGLFGARPLAVTGQRFVSCADLADEGLFRITPRDALAVRQIIETHSAPVFLLAYEERVGLLPDLVYFGNSDHEPDR